MPVSFGPAPFSIIPCLSIEKLIVLAPPERVAGRSEIIWDMDYKFNLPYPAKILVNVCMRHPDCTMYSVIPENRRIPCYALHSTEPDAGPGKQHGGYTVTIVQGLIAGQVR